MRLFYIFSFFGNKCVTGLGLCNFYKNASKRLIGFTENSGSQSGRYRSPGVNWAIQGVDK